MIHRDFIVDENIAYEFFNGLFDSKGFLKFSAMDVNNKSDVNFSWSTKDCYYLGSYLFKHQFQEDNVFIKFNDGLFNVTNKTSKNKYKLTSSYVDDKKNLYLEYQVNNTEDILYPSGLCLAELKLDKKYPTSSNPNRNKLEKIIDNTIKKYTTKNSFDYFIHKDLKGFLNRELDVYIKNKMLNNILDTQDIKAVEAQLSKTKVFKDIATPIINFLSQIEEFQKALWLKKKFVYDCNYCITLDRVSDEIKEGLLTNEAQIAEWKKLFGVEVKSKEDLTDFLVLDTKFLSPEDKWSLLSSIDNLDEVMDGVLIKSDNFQAMLLLLEKYRGKIDLTYIDPPFNTGSDFAYKDNFQDSSWLSLMENRLEIAREFLSDKGSFYLHLDHNANYKGRFLLDNTFGKENFINEITWKRKGGSSNPEGQFDIATDNIFIACQNRELYIFNKQYVLDSDDVKKYIDERFNNFDENNRQFMKSPIVSPNYRENLTYDYQNYKAPPNGWSIEKNVMEKWHKENKLYFPEKGERIYRKIYLDEYKGQLAQNLWIDIFVINPVAIERIQGALTQKPEALLQRILKTSSNPNSIVLDYHLGSGTTINVAHKLGRKWLGIEMGEYFEDVTLARTKKTLYGVISGISKELGDDLKKGGIFKYFSLESYEDTLNNLELKKNEGLFEALKDEYIINYMLDVETPKYNLEAFAKPFEYKLNITKNNESVPTSIDLVETFNYLIGLKVSSMYMKNDCLIVKGVNLKEEAINVIWRKDTSEPLDLDDSLEGLVYINGGTNIEGALSIEKVFI